MANSSKELPSLVCLWIQALLMLYSEGCCCSSRVGRVLSYDGIDVGAVHDAIGTRHVYGAR